MWRFHEAKTGDFACLGFVKPRKNEEVTAKTAKNQKNVKKNSLPNQAP